MKSIPELVQQAKSNIEEELQQYMDSHIHVWNDEETFLEYTGIDPKIVENYGANVSVEIKIKGRDKNGYVIADENTITLKDIKEYIANCVLITKEKEMLLSVDVDSNGFIITKFRDTCIHTHENHEYTIQNEFNSFKEFLEFIKDCTVYERTDYCDGIQIPKIDYNLYCPKCGLRISYRDVSPSYHGYCPECDEDFYRCELLSTKDNREKIKEVIKTDLGISEEEYQEAVKRLLLKERDLDPQYDREETQIEDLQFDDIIENIRFYKDSDTCDCIGGED